MLMINFHKNSIDIPCNVGAFLFDAKNSQLFHNNSQERIQDLVGRCEGLAIAWASVHNTEREILAKESAILYRLHLN